MSLTSNHRTLKNAASPFSGGMLCCVAFIQAENSKPIQTSQEYDYAPAAKKVAAKFAGTPGVFLHLGDSITVRQPEHRLGARRAGTIGRGEGLCRLDAWRQKE